MWDRLREIEYGRLAKAVCEFIRYIGARGLIADFNAWRKNDKGKRQTPK